MVRGDIDNLKEKTRLLNFIRFRAIVATAGCDIMASTDNKINPGTRCS